MTTNGFVLHDSATAPAASAAILDSVQKGWGFVPNLHRVLAESPAPLEAYATLWGIAEKTGFTAVERNVVYLSIIYENECTYCMAGHTGLSKMTKVGEDVIAAIRAGNSVADARLEALHVFAASVTRHRGVVSNAEVAALKSAGFHNRAILDVLVLAATKLISLHEPPGAYAERCVHEGCGMERATQACGVTTRCRRRPGDAVPWRRLGRRRHQIRHALRSTISPTS